MLQEKIFFLDRFLELSASEQNNFRARNFDNLEALYQTREDLIKNVGSLDKHIYRISYDSDFNESQKNDLQQISKKVNQKVRAILEEDLTLISFVEREKSIILKELNKTSVGRKAIRGYRDPQSTEV